MYNPSNGRPTGMWNQNFDFNSPIKPVISPAHKHEFGTGYDVQYKDSTGKVQARLDGLLPEEAAVLKKKYSY
jgi:hypothetical protein